MRLPLQHGHYRPDAIVRTSVIEPWNIQRYSPVAVARHTVDPFIYGVRPPGPSNGGPATSHAVAQAAQAVAQQFAQGKPATITADGQKQVVTPGSAPLPGTVGTIVQIAQGLVTGRPMTVAMPGSPPVVVHPPTAAVKIPTSSSATATVTPPTAAAPRAPSVTSSQGVAPANVSPSNPNQVVSTTVRHPANSAPSSTRRTDSSTRRPLVRPDRARRPAPPATAQRKISGLGYAPPAPPVTSPFAVHFQRAVAAQGQGVVPSWYQAARASASREAQSIFPPGYAPVMPATQWAAKNAGVGPFRRILGLWRNG